MIYIQQNATNNIFVNVSEYKTLAAPYYLWRLQNSQGKNIISFIPENITQSFPSMYANKYDVFEFTTYLSGATNFIYSGGSDCNLHLENENQYWLSIYETAYLSTNINLAGEKLLNQLAFVFPPVNNDFYSGNTALTQSNVIYYKS